MQVLKVTVLLWLTLLNCRHASSTSYVRKMMNTIKKRYSTLSNSLYGFHRNLSESIMDRYYKEPEPRIPPSPPTTYSEGDCVLNGAGVYGMSASRNVPLSFSYELEIDSNSIDSLKSGIIPTLEQAVGLDLAASLGVCRLGRQLMAENKKKIEHSLSTQNSNRYLLSIFGVGLLPVDQVNQNRTCQMSTNENSVCVIVDGEMSLYIPNDYSTSDVNAIVSSSYDSIKIDMNEGVYNKGNVKRVSFVESKLPSESKQSETSEETPLSKRTDSQKAYGYAIIASCAVLAVVAIVVMRKKKSNNHIALVESRDVEKETSKQLPDLEISVTDTTDISTIGSPSSKDDSSSSQSSSSISKISLPTIPAPLLGEDEDEKSCPDDEMLFTS